MEVLKVLSEYYGSYDEDKRLCSQHGSVEYLTTMRYIQKYLKPGMSVLEIGAATGRYSHTLARMGYEVDAVELVAHNIDIFKANTEAMRISASIRETLRTWICWKRIDMISPFCLVRCITYLPFLTSCRHCPRQSE